MAPPTCNICGIERSNENDYNPLQVLLGQPLGWYSGDDGELCVACFADMMRKVNR